MQRCGGKKGGRQQASKPSERGSVMGGGRPLHGVVEGPYCPACHTNAVVGCHVRYWSLHCLHRPRLELM